MLGELEYQMGPIPVYGENQGSLFIAENPVTEKWSKHILIKYHFIHDVVTVFKQIVLYYISGKDNLAKMFTKNLGHVKFETFRSQLGHIFENLTFSTKSCE